MQWRKVNSGELTLFVERRTIDHGAITEDGSPKYVVYTLYFTDGSVARSTHTATPDGIMNQYEVREGGAA